MKMGVAPQEDMILLLYREEELYSFFHVLLVNRQKPNLLVRDVEPVADVLWTTQVIPDSF